MNNGWVKLHRQIMNNEIFRHDRTAWHIFEVLLIVCDKKTGKWSGGRFQLADLCNEKPQTTYKALLRLKKAKMVTLSSNTRYSEIRICKWGDYQNDGNTKREQHSNNTVTTQEHSNKKENKKENNSTNVLLAKPGNEQINKMFDYWQDKVGYPITSKTTQNRRAAYNLQRKYKDDVYKLIDGVAMAQGERFAPQISDFAELQAKLNNLLAWGKKRTGDRMEIIA